MYAVVLPSVPRRRAARGARPAHGDPHAVSAPAVLLQASVICIDTLPTAAAHPSLPLVLSVAAPDRGRGTFRQTRLSSSERALRHLPLARELPLVRFRYPCRRDFQGRHACEAYETLPFSSEPSSKRGPALSVIMLAPEHATQLAHPQTEAWTFQAGGPISACLWFYLDTGEHCSS